LQRTVAVKVISPGGISAAAVYRFFREGAIMARLTHPNIVGVHDVGEHEGQPFIVMECVEGKTLHQVLQERKLGQKALLQLLQEAALGTAHAHAQGIVHRDLKPGNILVSSDGHPKIVDFGLAYVTETSVHLTKTGTALGTPRYMAPEQASGRMEKVGPHTDVYALGAILYEILTGRPAAPGKVLAEILAQITGQDPITPRSLNRKVPEDVETICLKALEKDPAKRYPTAREFADDLHRYLEDQTIFARPLPIWRKILRRAQRNKSLAVAVGMVLLFGVTAGLYFGIRSVNRSVAFHRTRSKAEDAYSKKRWSDAAAHYREAGRLAPNDPEIQKRTRISELLAQAEEARVEWEREQAKALEEAPPKPKEGDSMEVRQAYMAWTERVEEARRGVQNAQQKLEQCGYMVLGHDGKQEDARHLLAQIAYRRWKEASDSGTYDEIERFANRASEYGGEHFRKLVAGPATVDIKTRPGGATCHLFRYEEREWRLVPLPCSSSGKTWEVSLESILPWKPSQRGWLEEQLQRIQALESSNPLVKEARNEVTFPLKLRPGSYLFVFDKPGFVETRLPILVTPNRLIEVDLRLLRVEEVPPGFLYVPEGEFISGGVPSLVGRNCNASPRATILLKGYLIAQYPTTWLEYLLFLM